MNQLFADATRSCTDCEGSGLQDAVAQDCPSCNGIGSVWAKPIEEIIALRRQVLASYPDAASASSRLDSSFTKKEQSIYLTRKIKLTEEQLQRLSQITNSLQQEAIQKALKQDEGIPEYAWHPVPKHLDYRAIFWKFGKYINAWEKRLRKAGISTEEIDSVDPKDAAEAFWGDKAKLAEIASKIKENKKRAKEGLREILRSILDSAFSEVVEATPYGTMYRGKQELNTTEAFREVKEKLDEDSEVLEDIIADGPFETFDKLGGNTRGLLGFEYYNDGTTIDLLDLGGPRSYVLFGDYSSCGFLQFVAALSNPINSHLLNTFITHLFRENGEDFHVFLSASLPHGGIINSCPDLIDRDNLKRAIWHLFRRHIWATYDEPDDLPPAEQLAYFETYFKESYREPRRRRQH